MEFFCCLIDRQGTGEIKSIWIIKAATMERGGLDCRRKNGVVYQGFQDLGGLACPLRISESETADVMLVESVASVQAVEGQA